MSRAETKTQEVYALELEDNKVYVGRTANLEKRFAQHVEGRGASFTARHRPLGVLESHAAETPFDEDRLVKHYMAEYGIENVRGGSYCQAELRADDYERLSREIRHAKGACLRCGHTSHYASSCYATKDVDGNPLVRQPSHSQPVVYDSSSEESSNEYEYSEMPTYYEPRRSTIVCYYCNKEGHTSPYCYARQADERRARERDDSSYRSRSRSRDRRSGYRR